MKTLFVYALTFGWIWRGRQRRAVAEQRLAAVLETHGDASFEARHATDVFSRAEFAALYGRHAPSPVRQCIKALARQGMPLSDLRILLANRMLIARNGTVSLRTDLNLSLDYWIGWLMIVFGCLLMSGLLTCIYQHCGNIPWLPTLGALLWMGLGYFFMSLYTIYPYAIARRYRALLH